ncbi:hypothetical protein Bcer98_0827 [Bacillus cytotoxicus NVH 391-98]|uniref:Uncharacterized protein n=1 Tax=Bacillus cytotoxicus (strain DSM 22905 / CIP 110041 / 391-98 / NVH 391-98) TaxID=315749 RepID=A7GM05_BACCN|nr:hypothetical protein Bcer98_0827 [Bacillus cytotoxicus NVH 391-98]
MKILLFALLRKNSFFIFKNKSKIRIDLSDGGKER